MNFLYVFIGGGLGAMARYGISTLVPSEQLGFPKATFIANVISCILLGYLMGFLTNKGLDQKSQLLMMTGFCGGFSTFSTFSAESFKLLEAGQMGTLASYVILSFTVCVFCIWLGFKLAS